MSERPCAVQALGRTWTRRLTDRIHRGHARHVCNLDRHFAAYHDGDHECACGLNWPQQATDDGPVPTVKRMRRVG